MANKVLQTEFRAKDGGLIAMMKDTGSSADQLKKKLLELQSVGKGGDGADGGGGSVVKELKAGLGAKSNIGQLGKALKGGGAILGLTLLANELGKAAAKAKELTDQFKAGKISGGQMAEELAKGLPVIGGFISAGRDIKDLLASFDGLANSGFGKLIGLDDLNYAQKINKELAVTKDVDDAIAVSLEKQKTLLKQIAEETTKSVQTRVKLLKEGDDLKQYELKIDAENRLTEIAKKRQAALDDAENRHDETAKKVRSDEAGMTPAQAQHAERELAKNFNDEKLKINGGFNDEIREANATTRAEVFAAEREHAEKMNEFLPDAANDLADTQKEIYARRLKEMGDGLGSELVLIKKNADDKREAIDKALKERSKGASQYDVDLFKRAARDQTSAVDDEEQEAARLAIKAQQEQAVKTLQEGQLDVLRHQADAGDDNAAAELKRLETAKANNDEQRKLLELLKQQLTPAERATALAELQALKTADHAGVVKQLQDQQLDVLKAQADNGASGKDRLDAKRKLEALELTKKYNEEAAKAAAIIQNPNATQADKQAATSNLKAYAATLAKEFDKNVGGTESLKTTANLQERSLLDTGVAAAARSQSDPAARVAKNSDAAVKLQEGFNKAFAQFVEWQKSQAAKNPTVVFGVSD